MASLFVKHIPLSRMGLPEEIAEAVCYFASDASAYTTGQILTVSGGFGLATPVYGELVNEAHLRQLQSSGVFTLVNAKNKNGIAQTKLRRFPEFLCRQSDFITEVHIL